MDKKITIKFYQSADIFSPTKLVKKDRNYCKDIEKKVITQNYLNETCQLKFS